MCKMHHDKESPEECNADAGNQKSAFCSVCVLLCCNTEAQSHTSKEFSASPCKLKAAQSSPLYTKKNHTNAINLCNATSHQLSLTLTSTSPFN